MTLAPIAQRIERRPPKPEIEVQFLLGVEAMAGGERRPPKPEIEVRVPVETHLKIDGGIN